MAGQPKSKASRRSDSGAQDPRFASISTDPRFRLPSTKNARVGVDQRFARMFKDEDFQRKAQVDRYGRKVGKGSEKQKLQRLYQAEDEVEDESAEEEDEVEVTVQKGAKPKPKQKQIELASASEDEESDEVDEDGDVEAELKRLNVKRDPAREGGFSSSDESSSEDEEEDEELEAELADEEQANAVPMGEVSSRLAVVNLDWDNIRASDVMAVAQSFIPSDGRIKQVSIYPSEFGKERMEKEELEGPPRDIFSSSKAQTGEEDDDEEDSEEEEERIRKELVKGDTGEEFDSNKLRQYQLDRLRYYYAVITCDSKPSAKAMYDAMDGREYLSTANFFDLRFIPDEVNFDDDKPRDECKQLPAGYKPNDFVTDALTHSKVRLTWDNDDTSRKEAQKRAFSRAEIDENDLQAYIGSGSSGEESEEEEEKAVTGSKADREAQRQKMRAALGLSAEPSKGGKNTDGPVGNMQITFSSGLSSGAKGGSVFENEPIRDETTREKYVRKEKERKEKRRQKAKDIRAGVVPEDVDDEKKDKVPELTAAVQEEGDKEDPFDDPFFNDAPAAQKAEKSQRKADRIKKREERQKEEEANAAKRAELELLMVDDKEDRMRHFNMNDIQKAEKAKKKGKKGKKAIEADDAVNAAQAEEDFKMQTQDPRFARLFESHEYAIDPTNPRYKSTQGMKALLDEGRKRRKSRPDQVDDAVDEERVAKKARKTESGDGEHDLAKLVAKVKGKTRKP